MTHQFKDRLATEIAHALGANIPIRLYDPIGDLAGQIGVRLDVVRRITSLTEAYEHVFEDSPALWIVRMPPYEVDAIRLSDMLAVIGKRQIVVTGQSCENVHHILSADSHMLEGQIA